MGVKRTRFIVRAAVLLALLAAGLGSAESTNAKSGADELAYGQETGYFFFWDPALISLADASTDPGVDYWQLTDGTTTAEIWAYTAPGVTPRECVDDFLSDLAADPGTESVEALPLHGGGPPHDIRGNGDSEPLAPIVITVDGDGGREKFAASVSCRDVIPGESVAVALEYMPARDYNEQGIDLVRQEGIDFYVYPGLHDNRTDVVALPSGTGGGQFIQTYLPCNTVVFDLLVEGYRDGGAATFDPEWVYAIDFAGQTHPVAATAWSLPAARPESVLDLAAGESGLVHGEVELPELQDIQLYIAAPTGEPVLLARSILGCGESRAAPVPIDID